jgi:hypothetical protein
MLYSVINNWIPRDTSPLEINKKTLYVTNLFAQWQANMLIIIGALPFCHGLSSIGLMLLHMVICVTIPRG